MQINITLLGQYLASLKCPIQIYIDTDETECFLRFLRGSDENGSRVEYLSMTNINEILSLNNVEKKMIHMRDLPLEELRLLSAKEQDKQKNISNILYGTLAKYIIQLFAAGTDQIIYPELEILPMHKKSHFAGLFDNK